jgi:hypothetical protein
MLPHSAKPINVGLQAKFSRASAHAAKSRMVAAELTRSI